MFQLQAQSEYDTCLQLMRGFRSFLSALEENRDFEIYDGDFDENATSKYNFPLSFTFRICSISFMSYSVGEVSLLKVNIWYERRVSD